MVEIQKNHTRNCDGCEDGRRTMMNKLAEVASEGCGVLGVSMFHTEKKES